MFEETRRMKHGLDRDLKRLKGAQRDLVMVRRLSRTSDSKSRRSLLLRLQSATRAVRRVQMELRAQQRRLKRFDKRLGINKKRGLELERKVRALEAKSRRR